ncbi:MAG TPA: ATP-grasp domain-containing protein [Gemmatimonadales bacterium]|nr:ATP-grasp domain-containing protein [Gemmatimonadales bacterium]
MPVVLFAAPILSENASRMIAAMVALPGVRAGVISQAPLEDLPPPLQSQVSHWRVPDVLDAGQLMDAVDHLEKRLGRVDRLMGAYEQLQVPLAEVRERRGIAGMRVEAARNFRDKARMKSLLRDAGIPCARHCLTPSREGAMAFAREIGFPLIVKPPSGAGAQATTRVDDMAALQAAVDAASPAPDRPVLIEEYMTGDEHSFETVSIGGRAVWHSLTHYYPSPLEVLRNPWIQWCIVLPREVEEPQYDDIRSAGVRALQVLGMETGLTHMEWFRRESGTIAISEVAARPPGAQIMTVVSRAHDFDFVAAWARLMVFGEFSAPPRKYSVGAAYLRGQGNGGGRVTVIHGLDQVQREIGSLVVDAKLPTVGQSPTGSYEGEGFVILRHPQTAVVQQALKRLISLVRVELG